MPLLHAPKTTYPNSGEALPILYESKAILRRARPRADWVAKVISRIGKKAGVVVDPGNQKTGKPAKFASAHDLRRSCSERLLDAGVPPLEISRVLRHASWETTGRHYAPGDVQKAARVLRQTLCGVR